MKMSPKRWCKDQSGQRRWRIMTSIQFRMAQRLPLTATTTSALVIAFIGSLMQQIDCSAIRRVRPFLQNKILDLWRYHFSFPFSHRQSISLTVAMEKAISNSCGTTGPTVKMIATNNSNIHAFIIINFEISNKGTIAPANSAN